MDLLLILLLFALAIEARPLNNEQLIFNSESFNLECFNRNQFALTVQISSNQQNMATISHLNRTTECTSPRCIATQRIDEDDETPLIGYACANLSCEFINDDDGQQQCLPNGKQGDALCQALDRFSTAPRILCPKDLFNENEDELTECMIESGSMVGEYEYFWCSRKQH